ncbi:MAG TPA: hypothetical protein VFG53_18650 [Anaeromyxobacter sp.]|nr:hypothetical protein [Anaeromyxobacter sp.]
MIHLQSVLAYSGLAAALALLVTAPSRGVAAIAVLAAGLEVLTQLQLLRLQVAHLRLGLFLGLALAVPALIAWFRSTSKTAITAAAIAAFVGLLQILAYALPRA